MRAFESLHPADGIAFRLRSEIPLARGLGAFLPRVEAGDIVLIGATTENPSFEVNSALLSRSKVHVLKPLERGDRRRFCGARWRIETAASAIAG